AGGRELRCRPGPGGGRVRAGAVRDACRRDPHRRPAGPASARGRTRRMSVLDLGRMPVLAAPMAGGPSTPTLVVAAAECGSYGFLPAGYRSAEQLACDLAAVREHTDDFGVNLFVPDDSPFDRDAVLAYRDRITPELERAGVAVPEPRWVDDDAWPAKIELLV